MTEEIFVRSALPEDAELLAAFIQKLLIIRSFSKYRFSMYGCSG